MSETMWERREKAIHEALRSGPTTFDALLGRLDELELLDDLVDELGPDEELDDALDGELIQLGGVWMTPGNVVASTTHLVDGFVLTHRITDTDLRTQTVPTTPDLSVLDTDAHDGLAMPGGRLVHCRSESHVPGEDHSTFEGPDGWLSGFNAGDLVAFHRSSKTVRVERVDDPTDGEHEVDVFRAVVDDRIRPGQGDEAYPLVMDALAVDAFVLRQSTVPLGELLERAGLDRRGFTFGRRGESWTTIAEETKQLRRQRLIDSWQLAQCCVRAFDVVDDAFSSFQTSDGDDVSTIPADVSDVADALAHGSVAPAFVAEMLGDPLLLWGADGHEALRKFTQLLLDEQPEHPAPARFVLGREADRRGDAVEAEAAFTAALRDDAEYWPASAGLAAYEVDRGNIEQAVKLLRTSESPDDRAPLERLTHIHEVLEEPYRRVGRNDPCPCGSGLKYKQCCLRERLIPLSYRPSLLWMKLMFFVNRSRRIDPVLRLSTAAGNASGNRSALMDESLLSDPVILDVAILDAGIAADYLEERAHLLPADETTLLRELLASDRELWKVVGISSDGLEVVLRRAGSSDEVTMLSGAIPHDVGAGDLVYGRTTELDGRHRFAFHPMVIPEELADDASRFLEQQPSADELASWYGRNVPIAAHE